MTTKTKKSNRKEDDNIDPLQRVPISMLPLARMIQNRMEARSRESNDTQSQSCEPDHDDSTTPNNITSNDNTVTVNE